MIEEQLEVVQTLIFQKKRFNIKRKQLSCSMMIKETLTGFPNRKNFRSKKTLNEMHFKIKHPRNDMKK